jgi:diguanylate cyclase (GGDEF)-like protein
MGGRAGILLVGDSPQDQRIHATTLQGMGFNVVTARDMVEVLEVLEHHTPDLILLEAGMKNSCAFKTCRKLKELEPLAHTPVIFITEDRNSEIINRIYDSGAVDFIYKPCPLTEFMSRIETQIQLYQLVETNEKLRVLAIDANPLTHLPGNNTIVMTIQEAIDQKQDMAIVYTDLDNFKSYNDAYGFSAGDDVLLFTANTLQDVVRLNCPGESFLGHIGGDDFVIMVPDQLLEKVGEDVVRVFDESIPEFYTEEDRKRGKIRSTDRAGVAREYPLVSISLAGTRLCNHGFTRYIEVAALCAELKKKAKETAGSNLFIDRRVGQDREAPQMIST